MLSRRASRTASTASSSSSRRRVSKLAMPHITVFESDSAVSSDEHEGGPGDCVHVPLREDARTRRRATVWEDVAAYDNLDSSSVPSSLVLADTQRRRRELSAHISSILVGSRILSSVYATPRTLLPPPPLTPLPPLRDSDATVVGSKQEYEPLFRNSSFISRPNRASQSVVSQALDATTHDNSCDREDGPAGATSTDNKQVHTDEEEGPSLDQTLTFAADQAHPYDNAFPPDTHAEGEETRRAALESSGVTVPPHCVAVLLLALPCAALADPACVTAALDMLLAFDAELRALFEQEQRFLRKHVLAGHTAPVTCLAVCHSRALAVTGSADQTVRVWNLARGDSHVRRGPAASVTGVCISSTGQCVAASTADGFVFVWLSSQTHPIAVLPVGRPATCVALTDDDATLVCGAGNDLLQWDLTNVLTDATPEAVTERCTVRAGHTGAVTCLASGPQRWMLSGDSHGNVLVWPGGAEPVSPIVLAGHAGGVTSVSFIAPALIQPPASTPRRASSEDACTWLALSASACDGTARLWSLDSAECLRVLGGTQWTGGIESHGCAQTASSLTITAAAALGPGTFVTSDACSDRVMVWDTRVVLASETDAVCDDEGTILTTDSGDLSEQRRPTLPTTHPNARPEPLLCSRVLQSDTPLAGGPAGSGATIHCVAASRDGRRVLAAMSDHTVRAWKLSAKPAPVL